MWSIPFKACLALNDQRNHVAHGLLTHGEGSIEAIHVSGQLKSGVHFSEHSELKAPCDESQRLCQAVLKLGGDSLVLA